jgi:signal transduction histidine kinase
MTILQAFRQFMLDIPNIAVSVLAASVAWTLASTLDRGPDWPETIWFGLCSAGAWYHWGGLRELRVDLLAIMQWPDHDGVDLETIDNSIRRERIRFTAKSVFGIAGLIMMFVPPRVVEEVDLVQQVVIVLLIFAVLALDVDAVLDRRSRRRQLALIHAGIERRRDRRRALEAMFQPLFETMANATSEKGRVLAHDINTKLSMVVGTVEILKGSIRLDDEERALVLGMDETVEEICEQVAELHELVRDLAIPREGHGGSDDPAGPIQPADQP